jgi:hypothetical protein
MFMISPNLPKKLPSSFYSNIAQILTTTNKSNIVTQTTQTQMKTPGNKWDMMCRDQRNDSNQLIICETVQSAIVDSASIPMGNQMVIREI